MNYLVEFHRQKLHGWKSTVVTGLTNSAQTVCIQPAKFGGYFIYNPNASAVYVQVYSTSDAISVGSTAPIARFGIPATAGANLELDRGLRGDSGIQVAATTTATGSGAPSTALEMTAYWID